MPFEESNFSSYPMPRGRMHNSQVEREIAADYGSRLGYSADECGEMRRMLHLIFVRLDYFDREGVKAR